MDGVRHARRERNESPVPAGQRELLPACLGPFYFAALSSSGALPSAFAASLAAAPDPALRQCPARRSACLDLRKRGLHSRLVGSGRVPPCFWFFYLLADSVEKLVGQAENQHVGVARRRRQVRVGD